MLHNGALLAEGSVAEMQADPAVQAVYVGAEKVTRRAAASRSSDLVGGYGGADVVRGVSRRGRAPARCCA